MYNKYRKLTLIGLVSFGLGLVADDVIRFAGVAEAQSSDRAFELRTYTTHPGRIEALHARFANHTVELFERHGITNVGYFRPDDAALAENTLVYLIAHDSRESAEASWAEFRADPEWQRAREESQRDGQIVENVESLFLSPTHYSGRR